MRVGRGQKFDLLKESLEMLGCSWVAPKRHRWSPHRRGHGRDKASSIRKTKLIVSVIEVEPGGWLCPVGPGNVREESRALARKKTVQEQRNSENLGRFSPYVLFITPVVRAFALSERTGSAGVVGVIADFHGIKLLESNCLVSVWV